MSPIKLFDENKTLSGFNLRHLMYQHGSHEYVRRAVNHVYALWNEGKIKPVVDSTWALEDVPEAMQKMHDRKNIGKIVLDPSLEPKPKPATPAKGKAKDKKTANQEEKKASSVESEEGEKKKEPELTNGTSEDKSDSGKHTKIRRVARVFSEAQLLLRVYDRVCDNLLRLKNKMRRTTSKDSLVFSYVFQIRKKRNLAELTVVIKYI